MSKKEDYLEEKGVEDSTEGGLGATPPSPPLAIKAYPPFFFPSRLLQISDRPPNFSRFVQIAQSLSSSSPSYSSSSIGDGGESTTTTTTTTKMANEMEEEKGEVEPRYQCVPIKREARRERGGRGGGEGNKKRKIKKKEEGEEVDDCQMVAASSSSITAPARAPPRYCSTATGVRSLSPERELNALKGPSISFYFVPSETRDFPMLGSGGHDREGRTISCEGSGSSSSPPPPQMLVAIPDMEWRREEETEQEEEDGEIWKKGEGRDHHNDNTSTSRVKNDPHNHDHHRVGGDVEHDGGREMVVVKREREELQEEQIGSLPLPSFSSSCSCYCSSCSSALESEPMLLMKSKKKWLKMVGSLFQYGSILFEPSTGSFWCWCHTVLGIKPLDSYHPSLLQKRGETDGGAGGGEVEEEKEKEKKKNKGGEDEDEDEGVCCDFCGWTEWVKKKKIEVEGPAAGTFAGVKSPRGSITEDQREKECREVHGMKDRSCGGVSAPPQLSFPSLLESLCPLQLLPPSPTTTPVRHRTSMLHHFSSASAEEESKKKMKVEEPTEKRRKRQMEEEDGKGEATKIFFHCPACGADFCPSCCKDVERDERFHIPGMILLPKDARRKRRLESRREEGSA